MTELLDFDDINIGGSIFWILIILLGFSGLVYLLIWSLHHENIKGIAVGVIFMGMITAGILLSRLKVFDWASWGDNALSFTIGFGLWILLNSLFGQQSVLSVSQNGLFSTIASELPQFVNLISNVFMIPIVEELFWMVGMPFALISIMKAIGKKYEIWDNPYLQTFILVIILSTTFAFFHVGKLFVPFIIASMIFRTIMVVMVYGEYEFDLLKGINLVAGFSIGAHISNNLIEYGISKAWIVLQDQLVVTIIIVVFFGAMFLTALNRVLGFILGSRPSLEDLR